MNRTDARRDVFVVLLAAAAGAFDALVYLDVHVFVANMTGNTVLSAIALASSKRGDLAHATLAIGAFFLGAVAGTAVGKRAQPSQPWPPRASIVLGIEALALAVCAVLLAHPALAYDVLALAAFAMGLQSAATRDVHGSDASTTYMSGTMERIGSYLVASLAHGFDGRLGVNGATFVVYFCAAFAVALAVPHLPHAAAVVVATIAAAVAVTALTAPRIVTRGGQR